MNKYTFEEMYIGMKEAFEVTVTTQMMESFLSITGDINPLHNDETYAQEKGFRGKVVYGLLSASFLSTLVGVYLPGEKCIIQSVEIKCVKPVYIGNRLNVQGEVEEINTTTGQVVVKAVIYNENMDKVLRGKIKLGVLD